MKIKINVTLECKKFKVKIKNGTKAVTAAKKIKIQFSFG